MKLQCEFPLMEESRLSRDESNIIIWYSVPLTARSVINEYSIYLINEVKVYYNERLLQGQKIIINVIPIKKYWYSP